MSFKGEKGFAIGHANVEDVPIKFGDQCLPPKKVTMPLNFEMGNPTEALFMEYDFSLENRVLNWVEVQHRLRNEAAAASKSRAKAAAEAAAEAATALAAQRQAEEEERMAKESVPTSTTQDTSNTSHQPAAFAGLSNGGILMPTVLADSTPPPMSAQATNSSFDLSDFERAHDPFDTMELKVLDDMAELDKVLQVTQPVSQAMQVTHVVNQSVKEATSNDGSLNLTEDPPARPPVPPRPSITASKSLKDVDYPDIDSLASSDLSVSLSTGGGGSSAAFYKAPQQLPSGLKLPSIATNPFVGSAHQVLPPIPTPSNRDQPPNSAMYSATNTYTPFASYPATQGSSQQQPTQPAQPHKSWSSMYGQTQNAPQYPPQNRNNNSPSNGLVTGLNDVKPLGTSALSSSQGSEFPGLRSARSTPDISGLLGEDVRCGDKRPISHTPPPIRNYTPPLVAPKPAAKQDWRHYQPLQPSLNPRTGSPKPSGPPVTPPRPSQTPQRSSGGISPRRPAPSLPDPYRQMAPSVQQLVNSISDMGFQRARVARTIEKLGQDDKKVVDHLCAITRLEDTGFPPDLAETALQLFENNTDKAKQFLTLLNQFTEFGFKEEKVRDALIKNNLDEDKTLDCLTST